MYFFLVGLTLIFGMSNGIAQEVYGAKGLFPIYDANGQWLIFDKTSLPGGAQSLKPGGRFLVIGSAGAEIFEVVRASNAFGGACSARKPIRLRTGILKGSQKSVVDPILAIKVAANFSLRGSHATYQLLRNEVSETLYQTISTALTAAIIDETSSGGFRFKADDEGAVDFRRDPRPEKIAVKIDFAAKVPLAGLPSAMILITSAQISNSSRRCLRLANADKLIGDCLEMPSDLMAETGLLHFATYDPAGKGNPLLLGYTTEAPLWGHERWGFALRASGPKLILHDAMDPRCREGF